MTMKTKHGKLTRAQIEDWHDQIEKREARVKQADAKTQIAHVLPSGESSVLPQASAGRGF
ncbi:MAG: hypothetical protein R3245_05970 [Kiloniellales bacterium]|nr:hypothetical protein [Kiloniellales bacterium]